MKQLGWEHPGPAVPSREPVRAKENKRSRVNTCIRLLSPQLVGPIRLLHIDLEI